MSRESKLKEVIPSPITLMVNGTLVVIGLILVFTLLRMGASFDYHYGRSEIRGPLMRKILIILLLLILMSFAAAAYNLLGPWVWGV